MKGKWVCGTVGVGVLLVAACSSDDDGVSCGARTVEIDGECVPVGGGGEGGESDGGTAGAVLGGTGGSSGTGAESGSSDAGDTTGGTSGAGDGGMDAGGSSGAPGQGEGGSGGGFVDPDPLGCADRDVTFATVIEGVIMRSQTWSGVVHVPRDVIVRNEATITIAPGTKIIVGFGASIEFGPQSNRPRLRALGTAEAPIRFCGEADVRGYWKQLVLRSSVASSELRNVLISNAGREAASALALETAVTLDAVRVEHAATDGVHATAFNAGSRGLRVTAVNGVPLAVKAPAALDVPLDSELVGNGTDVIRIDFDTYAQDLVFRDAGVPWRLATSLFPSASIEAPSVTLEAGVVVELTTGRTFNFGTGTVRMRGESDAPVVFRDYPCVTNCRFGDIGSGSLTVGPGTKELTMEHVRLVNLGYVDSSFRFDQGAFDVQRDAAVTIRGLEIVNATSLAAQFSGTGTFSPQSNDITVDGSRNFPTLSGILFPSCSYLFSLPRSTRILSPANAVISCLDSGTLRAFEGGYGFRNSPDLLEGVELAIEPGAKLHFSSGQRLTVSPGATLTAVGTAIDPIEFLPSNDDFFPSWGGINVAEGGSARLEHVVVSMGDFANVSTGSPIVLRNSVLRDSWGWGLIHAPGDTTNYRDTNTFADNALGDVTNFDDL